MRCVGRNGREDLSESAVDRSVNLGAQRKLFTIGTIATPISSTIITTAVVIIAILIITTVAPVSSFYIAQSSSDR